MKYWVECWKKYATFSGRARRKEYWMFVLFNMLRFGESKDFAFGQTE